MIIVTDYGNSSLLCHCSFSAIFGLIISEAAFILEQNSAFGRPHPSKFLGYKNFGLNGLQR